MREHLLHPRHASQYLVLVATLLFAALFSSGTVFAPHSQGKMLDQIASVVGMSASVPPNEYSQLAQQLTEKDRVLSVREAALVTQEEAQRDSLSADVRRANARTLIALAVALVVLFILVGLNFYFDIRRSHPVAEDAYHHISHEGELQTRL
ncbi:MAG: hypothetical protein UY81_C0041G0003 [Candidatus Giovannonibacteria bacterium GW2011_GWA2_53_7]|uniref:Uncharacterized protein n=1 Tax=Candidatus Giovannonibacteria bacterium GW2011_GWA2_53_7 TaxID=1618650 RepID=A0A0G2A3K0_9BACT|nr:MAG: hypothetical protein UY81_C0041G0003 [Candidatus Giovannonibacteria bacterium GW2011_GWA2_53_7]